MSETEDIPFGGIAETVIHGAEAVGHAVQGDWDGAAHEAFNMAGSALHTAADIATDGAFSEAEGIYDAAAPALGLPNSDEISHSIEQGVQDVGNALGDAAYNFMNPSDDDGAGGGDYGSDPGMDAGGGDYGSDSGDS